MTISDPGMPEQLRTLDHRELKWALGTVSHFPSDVGHLPRSPSPLTKRHELQQMLAKCQYRKQVADRLVDLMKERVIPHKEIEWIDRKNQRLLAWVLRKITQAFLRPGLLGIAPAPEETQTEQRYDTIIGLIDLWPIPFTEKIPVLSSWKAEWATTPLPPKKTKWLDASDHEQIQWAYAYVKANLNPMFMPEPVNHKERYDYILAALDDTSCMHKDSRELALMRFSKAWSQQKYRKEAGSPTYIPLKENVRKMLEELAEKEGRPRYKVVELLIERAYRESTDPTRTP